MTPHRHLDSWGPPEEEKLRKIVLEGISKAMEQKFSDSNWLSKTKREKLLYFAIDEFDLPLTYSWYLLGTSTRVNGYDYDAQDGPVKAPKPGVEDEVNEYSVRYFQDFFATTTFFGSYDLENVMNTNQPKFLCDFYNHEAGEKAELYIHSTKLRRELSNIEESLDKGQDNKTLNEWGGGSVDGVLSRRKEREVRDLVSKLHLDLTRLGGKFDTVRKPFIKGTDVIEYVLAKLTRTRTIDDRQLDLVNGLEDFYFDYVWKYPALLISIETATGPTSGGYRNEHYETFKQFDKRLLNQVQVMTKRHERAGLRPEPSDFTLDADPDTVKSLATVTKQTASPKTRK